MTIAETLNCFFTDLQSHLISTTGSQVNQELDLDPSLLHENATLNIPHVSKTRISELLLSIPTHKATGDDGISVKLLRIAAPAIAGPLSQLINRCIL